MILVHSATLNDLSPDCLQYKLLNHCLNPRIEQDDIDGQSIQKIRIAARSARIPGQQPAPFDSWFEVDVFLRIVDRGYRVIPQYRVNPFDRSFRIDMVVEGVYGRLAVECDGDHWHGADQYDADMARQRELERAGWRFWRVRGGAFSFDPDRAMQTLWELLSRYHIHPKGHESNLPKAIEEVSSQESEIRESDMSGAPSKESEQASTTLLRIQESRTATQGKETHKKDHSSKELQDAIVNVLEGRPNHSIALKALTSAVLQKLEIRTRGRPRAELDKRILRSVGVLKRHGQIEEYKAKNVRIRLT